MTLVDANLLLYAKVADFDQHETARSWLDRSLGGNRRVGLPWESLVAFVRLVTNPRVFPRPLDPPMAMAQVGEWLSRPAAWVPRPVDAHHEILSELLALAGTGGDLVADAHLAAIAVGNGLSVSSADTDFARFPGLSWENPLR